jgi:hypothetical protein
MKSSQLVVNDFGKPTIHQKSLFCKAFETHTMQHSFLEEQIIFLGIMV